MGIQVVGAACSIGGIHRGCRRGPEVFRRQNFSRLQQSIARQTKWRGVVREGVSTAGGGYGAIVSYCHRIRDLVVEINHADDLPVIIGGDHSCAIGTWSGVAQQSRGSFGMLWIDAHLDCHTPESSVTGAVHGMPLACLLGRGDAAFLNLCPKLPVLDPQATCVVGVRSFEPPEQALVKKLGVKVFYMSDIERLGLAEVLRRAWKVVTAGSSGFGISIDLDAIDPCDAPGVSVPEPCGLVAAELIAALQQLPPTPALKSIEIAEFNPVFDRDNKTGDLIGRLLVAIFT